VIVVKYQILIVEDQPEISSIVSKYLVNEGHFCFAAKDGFEALDIFNNNKIHLVLLDVMMPGIDGFEVLREIRKISDIPVIMLTAKQEEIDRLKGFDIGADDYVIKPFSVNELMRRVNAILKRVYNNLDEIVYRCADLSLFTKSMKLFKNELEIPITSAEYALLYALFRFKGQVLTREQLIERAYGCDYEGYDRNVDSYIKRIRQKIEDDPKNPRILITKYGAGYVLGGVSD
jgi:DNA-binding response OmpR family regulator